MALPVNILLVDDEQRNLDALEVILNDPRYCLLRATDADQALHLLLQHEVAAIVLDIKMPGVSGVELAKMIKGTKKYGQIPIVFLTAYMVDDRDILAGYGAGAVDYLTKPVNPQILQHKIAVFAELFWKTRALAELNETLETRVQERTAELAKSEAALRLADQQKDAFLATLAHELRNPLATLRTGLAVLTRSHDTEVRSARTLGAMNRQLDHMVRLIDDLLDVARINRGVIELKLEHVDLVLVVRDAAEAARPFAERKKQAFELQGDGPIGVTVDPVRIAQVVGNLLHNACKYAPENSRILIRLRASDDQASVQVIDEGAGIPEGQLERVFDMFARIERSAANANSGLGIGLALGRQLATLHGGTLVAESAGPGRGATFTLSLPIGPSAAPASSSGEGVAPAIKSSNPLQIVVIEDNEDSADMLEIWLQDLGHSVRVARNGLEGIELVSEFGPQIVISDLGLPDLSGLEVCQRIRSLAVAKQPLMVALTGWGGDEDRERTRAAGFDAHLVKPVSPEAMNEVLAATKTRLNDSSRS